MELRSIKTLKATKEELVCIICNKELSIPCLYLEAIKGAFHKNCYLEKPNLVEAYNKDGMDLINIDKIEVKDG